MATNRTSFYSGNLKGQVATEFMLYTAVFMFIAIAAFLIVDDLQKSELPLQQTRAVKEVGDGFLNAITLSIKGGEGFTYHYTFPTTLFGIPYKIDMTSLSPSSGSSRPNLIIDWTGSYGNFSYQYYVPIYKYKFGGCLSSTAPILTSNACSNVLTLNNDGENLTLTQ